MAMNSLALSTNNLSAQLATKLDVAGGKVLQVVRATDATDRSTTSTSFVDTFSVTITPQKSTSAIILIAIASVYSTTSNGYVDLRISDNSNNAISGAEQSRFGDGTSAFPQSTQTLFAYSLPGTTSATIYKLRFKTANAGTVNISGSTLTSQLYAIEVSA